MSETSWIWCIDVLLFNVFKIRVKNALSKSGLPDIDYSLNPYIGCSHACIYCYARLYVRDQRVSRKWGSIVFVKENLLEILDREVKRIRRGVVGLGTITDGYQPVEAIYKLSRGSLEILLKNGFHVSIQTKNTLVLRDIDILVKYRELVDVGYTITTMNHKIARFLEPYSSPPRARAYALEKLSNNGIATWIFYGPVIAGFNDDDETVEEIARLASRTRSKVLVDKLHVKSFMHQADHPLNRIVRNLSSFDWRSFLDKVYRYCEKYGVECIEGFAEPSKKSIGIDEFLNRSVRKH